MRRIGVLAVTLVCSLLVTLAVQAQPGGGRGPGRGMGFGMMGGGMGMGLLPLLQVQDVQDDLQLTPDQKDKLRELAEGQRGGMRGMADLSQDEMRAKMRERQEATQKQVAAILKPEQLKRLEGIQLQVGGAAALLTPETQKALALTPDQIEKIRVILQQIRDKMGDSFANFRDMSQDERRAAGEKMRAAQKEAVEEATKVLTPQQRETLDKLKGKKLDIEPPMMMGPGRRGG